MDSPSRPNAASSSKAAIAFSSADPGRR
jgi:hypothetical protein